MKRAFATLTVLSLGLMSQQALADSKDNQLKTDKDKISYSIGVDVGKSIQKQKIDINPDSFMSGFKDGQNDKNTLMTEAEIRQTLMKLQNDLMERQKAQMKELSTKNLSAGEKFLTENKKQKDVVTLPDGLQYKIIKEGKGDSPKATDMVTVHYRGKLIDGTEFDSSYSRNEPVKLSVNGVIPGWTEALQMMKPGAKWELFIPAKLAYGENGVGQIIGPNSTLIFDVELLSVDKNDTKSQTSSLNQKDKPKAAKSKG